MIDLIDKNKKINFNGKDILESLIADSYLSYHRDLVSFLNNNKLKEKLNEIIYLIQEQLVMSDEKVMDFICENLKTMQYGNDFSLDFLNMCGVPSDKYNQNFNTCTSLFLTNATRHIINTDQTLLAFANVYIINSIMKEYYIGIYNVGPAIKEFSNTIKRTSNTGSGAFVDINRDLGDCYYDKIITIGRTGKIPSGINLLHLMACAYAMRFTACGLYLQKIYDKSQLKYWQDAWQIIAMLTSGDVDFQETAAKMSIFYIKTYDYRFNKDFSTFICSIGQHVTQANAQVVRIDNYKLLMNTICEAILQSKKNKEFC